MTYDELFNCYEQLQDYITDRMNELDTLMETVEDEVGKDTPAYRILSKKYIELSGVLTKSNALLGN